MGTAGAQATSGINYLVTGSERDKINQAVQGATSVIGGVKPPSISKMRIKLEGLVQQGILTPEQAQTFLQEASAYDLLDPRTRDAQLGALEEMQGIVDERGMDPQARLALRQLREETGAAERGSREAILQNAAERGISGSGVELASQMANQQGSATRLANQGFQAAADANQRKLAAIQGLHSMGSATREQDMAKAEAQNAINQFNAANRQSIENINVASRNAAQEKNLSEKQRIADSNVATRNQQETYNKALYQQDFGNRLAQGQAYANAALGGTQAVQQLAEQKTAPMTANAAKWSDERLKKDVTEIDPQEFLDSITGFKYKYKDKSKGQGDQIGVMAQDVEKEAPEAVIDLPEGKAIDYSKLGGELMAAVASMNKRLKEVEAKADA